MKVTVNRKAHFNAAHRLHRHDWDDAKNERIFGKCSNPYYHGHNYELIVSVTGKVDPETGFVVDMKWLADLITERVEDYLDRPQLIGASLRKKQGPTRGPVFAPGRVRRTPRRRSPAVPPGWRRRAARPRRRWPHGHCEAPGR